MNDEFGKIRFIRIKRYLDEWEATVYRNFTKPRTYWPLYRTSLRALMHQLNSKTNHAVRLRTDGSVTIEIYPEGK